MVKRAAGKVALFILQNYYYYHCQSRGRLFTPGHASFTANMKTTLGFAVLFSALFFGSPSAQAESIGNLPALSKLLIHHFDCRVALLPASGAPKGLFFKISPHAAGHESSDFTLTQGADKIVASANAQMLGLVWTRGTQTVANAQAWVQKSTTQALVLMVLDPKDESTQVHLNCNAVTFDDVKGGSK
jgi:hypothetical protein